MKFAKKISKKINNFFYDHILLREVTHSAAGALFAIVSAALFAFGFTCFTSHASQGALDAAEMKAFTLVTGGVSGITQNIALVLNVAGVNVTPNVVQAIGYIVFNIPLILFAFFKISKRFAILTLVNVVASSFFIRLFDYTGIAEQIASSPFIISNVLNRTLFAAVCTGLGSAIAFKADISCGGIDIVTYYFALRKSTSVGKYNILVNSIIIVCYSLILAFTGSSDPSTAILSIFYSVIYLFVSALVIDAIHIRNKKIQLQIITEQTKMPEVLMANFPHGITLTNGKGAYSNKDKIILYMIVSSTEVKNVVRLAKRVDMHAFISVIPLNQVYGNFFIKPVD